MITNLALTGIFNSGKMLLIDVLGFLVIVLLVGGAAKSIGTHFREGAGSGITASLQTIIHASILALSIAIAGAVVYVAHHYGLDSQAPSAVVQPWSQ